MDLIARINLEKNHMRVSLLLYTVSLHHVYKHYFSRMELNSGKLLILKIPSTSLVQIFNLNT